MGISQDFLEKATLLCLTAGLSGFLVPYVLKRIDERKLREQKSIDALRIQEQKEFDAQKLQEQKEFDANLIRGNNVLEAQIKLLENLSESLWELQLLSLAVSYYKIHPNQERYESAYKDYDEKSWRLFKDVRCEVSKSTRLVSEDQYRKLLIFFNENLIQNMDKKLMDLIENNASFDHWKDHYDWLLYRFPEEIDEIVTPLAKELRLASPTAMSNKTSAEK